MYALGKEAGWSMISPSNPLLPRGILLVGSGAMVVREFELGRAEERPGPMRADKVTSLPGARTSRFQALKDLRRLRHHAAGWDGRISSAANRTSFDLAEKFLALLSSARIPFAVEAELFSNGTAVLSVKRDDLDAQFQFFEDGIVAAVVETAETEWDDEVAGFDGTVMPPSIAQHLGL